MVAFDDGPFGWDDERTDVIGVVARGPDYVEAVLRTEVLVDGDDATERLLAALRTSRYREGLRAILLDGVVLGGFNVVDLAGLHAELRIPVVAFTRDTPDFDAIRAALEKHFPDGPRRFALLSQWPPAPVDLPNGRAHVSALGMTVPEASALLASLTVRGLVPEPLRLAHLIAAGVGRGESRGRP